MKFGSNELRVAALVMAGFVGCADGRAPSSHERVGEVSQDWSVASCDTPAADATFTGEIVGHVSPQSYNKCHLSYIVEVHDYALVDAGVPPDGEGGAGSAPPPVGNGSPVIGSGAGSSWTLDHLSVAWNDAVPTRQADCVLSWVGGILYYDGVVDGGQAWVPMTQQVQRHGVWNTQSQTCSFPKVYFSPLGQGYSYRVAATARSGANQTRKLLIATGP